MEHSIVIRPIEKRDNAAIAGIIRMAFHEFDLPKDGTVYSDATTDDLFSMFAASNACYFVAEDGSDLLGGCGIFPTDGLPQGYAELVKFYISPIHRGRGVGKLLMEKSIANATQMGYKHLYLESFPQLSNAVEIYTKQGFEPLTVPLGNSGHFACTIWMSKRL